MPPEAYQKPRLSISSIPAAKSEFSFGPNFKKSRTSTGLFRSEALEGNSQVKRTEVFVGDFEKNP